MNFLDDLNKLNQGKKDNEFSEINSKVYDEHNYILSSEKNPEFFNGLLLKLKKLDIKNIPYNKNGFTQEDLDKILNLHFDYRNFLSNVVLNKNYDFSSSIDFYNSYKI